MEWLRSGLEGPRSRGDAQPADEDRSGRSGGDPERNKRRRLRRGALVLVLGIFFSAGLLAALVGRGGWIDLQRRQEETRRLRHEVAKLRLEVAYLEHHVGRLETEPVERERIARERLGWNRAGEIDYLLPQSARPR